MKQAAILNPEAAKAISETVATQGINKGICVYCGDPADLVCDHCDAQVTRRNEAAKAREQREKERQRLGWFADKVPDLYLATDEMLVPHWARTIAETWNPQDRYGVTISGPSNSWKTRAAIKILERAFLAGKQIEFRQAGDLRREMNRMAREGGDSELLRELCAVPVLLVDDMGNQAFTEASEEFLLALFEGRINRFLPTITTTQFPSDEFLAKFSNRRIGMAVAKRIGPEYNWMINTATGNITEPQPPKSPHQ